MVEVKQNKQSVLVCLEIGAPKSGKLQQVSGIKPKCIHIVFFQETLGGMPACAYPQGYRKGRLSYTIVSPTTNARIEVLLKGKAFRIQRIGERDGYLSWNWKPWETICIQFVI